MLPVMAGALQHVGVADHPSLLAEAAERRSPNAPAALRTHQHHRPPVIGRAVERWPAAGAVD
jgi:hypothetical protein